MNTPAYPAISRFEQGQARFESVTGIPAQQFAASLEEVAPRFARYVMEWEFGDMLGESILGSRSREIVAVTSMAMLGASAAPILKLRIGTALQAGVSRQEIIDIFIQLAISAGFPLALAAIHVAKEKFTELDAGAGE